MEDNPVKMFGIFALIVIILYFAYRIGEKLANDEYQSGNAFWVWLFVIYITIQSLALTNQDNFIGIFGFIPILIYIFIKISNRINIDYSQRKTIKKSFLYIVSSIVTYIFTSTVFGYGITEASILAIIVAMVLGLSGLAG